MQRSGFTLIELLTAVAILAVLASLSVVAIDPARRIHTARNATRWNDTSAILSAYTRYVADHDGTLPSATGASLDTAPESVQIIGENVGPCATLLCGPKSVAAGACGLSGLATLLRPYLPGLPKDPITGSDDDTRYFVNRDAFGLLTVGACDAEGEGSGGGAPAPVISVTR